MRRRASRAQGLAPAQPSCSSGNHNDGDADGAGRGRAGRQRTHKHLELNAHLNTMHINTRGRGLAGLSTSVREENTLIVGCPSIVSRHSLTEWPCVWCVSGEGGWEEFNCLSLSRAVFSRAFPLLTVAASRRHRIAPARPLEENSNPPRFDKINTRLSGVWRAELAAQRTRRGRAGARQRGDTNYTLS